MWGQAMYNAALFSDRQELQMPAKKTASKKRNKAVSRQRVTRSKVAGKKRKVSKKKASAKKMSKKKVIARKKLATRKASKKKAAAKKKVTRKKPAAKKASKKKVAVKNKAAAKKAPLKKAPAKKTVAKKATRKRSDVLTGPIHGVAPYNTQRGEHYMGTQQLTHFNDILSAWKDELMHEVDRTVHHMQDEAANFPDPNDRATQESEFGLELRTRDRERKLLRKIASALARIDEGSYGYCEETGEEIGLKRLEARPVATLSVEAQERRELAERQFRDRDDRYR